MTLYEILEDYTQWLLDHGYCDDDVWCEPPKAVDRFFEDRKELVEEKFTSTNTGSPKLLDAYSKLEDWCWDNQQHNENVMEILKEIEQLRASA
jgi:hypothetical protein